MNDRITYAVVYRHKIEPEEWREYTPWFDSREEAKAEAEKAKKNERFIEVRIAKRVESFDFVG